MTRSNPRAMGLLLFVLLALAIAANIWLVPRWAWLATVGASIAGFGVMGMAANGRPAGILIDGRNVLSLSRLQACAWTILVLPAIAAAAAWNLHLAQGQALDLAIPQQLIIAMGISLGSLTATPALLSLKAQTPPAASQVAAASAVMAPAGAAGSAVTMGTLVGRQCTQDASWLDLFRGEEVGNAGSPDIGKVQKFLFTALLVGIYAAALWHAFGTSDAPYSGLPPLSDDFVWLLGVSHAGYLLYMSAPHSLPASADAVAVPAASGAAG